jgi:hypothetical protein
MSDRPTSSQRLKRHKWAVSTGGVILSILMSHLSMLPRLSNRHFMYNLRKTQVTTQVILSSAQ